MALRPKQQAFIEFYLACWNAAQAARDAGYTTKANVQGSRMLANASIQAAIAARLAELKMSADEVLTRLTDQARGSIAPFMRVSADGEFHGFDLGPDKPVHLIRRATSVKRTFRDESNEHSVTIELYDAQNALALLGKHHGLFVERTEISGPQGAPIPIQAYEYNAAIAAITDRPGPDRDPSGEDASLIDGPALGQVDDGRRD
jgi:phage terminase small subunit